MTAPLLELRSLEPVRPYITIDGVAHDLSVIEDFGLREQSRLYRLMEQSVELQRSVDALEADPDDPIGVRGAVLLDGVPTEADAERAIKVLDEVLSMILRAPDEVRAKLSEQQKSAILEAFSASVPAAPPTRMPGRPDPSTSAGSSLDSARSTVPQHG